MREGGWGGREERRGLIKAMGWGGKINKMQ